MCNAPVECIKLLLEAEHLDAKAHRVMGYGYAVGVMVMHGAGFGCGLDAKAHRVMASYRSVGEI